MDNEEVKILLDKYLDGKATAEEVALLETWYVNHKTTNRSEINDEFIGESVDRIWARLNEQPVIKVKLWPRVAVAAAAVAAITLGVWLYYTSNLNGRHLEPSLSSRATAKDLNDVAPGKNTATLTLANGKTINLSDAKTGVIIDATKLSYNDGTSILSSRANGLSSRANAKDPSGLGMTKGVGMTSVTTPRGGMYQVILPDGTHVWLNADSKISFPSQFIGKERKILLLYGEAYFEVAKNKQKPFIVDAGRQKIAVLGTHFNVNAYREEQAMKTTLLEGRVEVEDSGVSKVLTPGSQAYSGSDGLRIVTVNVNDIIDWKNGDFVFKGETLENIMRKVARWYNVQVEYAPNAPKTITLGGYVSRSRNISAVLELMERTGKVKFKVSGTTVTVTK
ncbi:FecR family protein [Pedobacter heparinus]|uniref:FecR family protein n=1 Tax=Pedobacter heparinus TaxID=984 RepID=UPI002930265E|nr:FecR domain-containing protein [Pedobacter heparinus]